MQIAGADRVCGWAQSIKSTLDQCAQRAFRCLRKRDRDDCRFALGAAWMPCESQIFSPIMGDNRAPNCRLPLFQQISPSLCFGKCTLDATPFTEWVALGH